MASGGSNPFFDPNDPTNPFGPPPSTTIESNGSPQKSTPSKTPTGKPNFVAGYDYEQKEPDEVTLKKNDLIEVLDKGGDGWFFGKNERTNQIGYFPGNFVVPLPESDAKQQQAQSIVEQDSALAVKLQAEEAKKRTQVRVQQNRDALLARQLQMEEQGIRQEVGMAIGAAKQPPQVSQRARGPASDDCESFVVRLIGSEKIRQDRVNPQAVIQVMKETIFARKQTKTKTASLYEIRVHADGVTLVDRGTTTKTKAAQLKKVANAPHRLDGPASFFPLDAISHAAYSPENPQLFGFITSLSAKSHSQCLVFQYDKSSVPICNAIGRAFKTLAQPVRNQYLQ
eukprot:m.23892 g.23892  ORF g.23892 m.23892 type:complete len:340 (+) comp7553_c0_seq1:208-1227(+)